MGSAAAVGAGYGLTVWEWAGPASAATLRAGDLDAGGNGRTLVIVEMGGGNDGLNTVVPLNDGRYQDLRPTLAINDALDLDGEVGLNPNLPNLAKRFGDGQVAIIEGLGYDDADLSHFGSFAIWWSAKGGSGGGGWLGSYLDQTVGFDDPLAAIGIGPGPSPALRGRQSFATTIADSSGLQPRLPDWLAADESFAEEWSDFTPAHVDATSLVGQVQRAIGLTVKARTKLSNALDAYEAPDTPTRQAQRAQYQDASVVDSLTLAAQLVQSPAHPRIIYVNGVGDFDTHEGQATRHPLLMQQLDDGIEAFFGALSKDKAADTVLMTVSEFGRRPAENGSGTDHGTANCQFVIGPKVTGGRYGEQPSLAKLDESGNLVHTADFRQLYATGLQWLGVDDAGAVLGDDFQAFSVYK